MKDIALHVIAPPHVRHSPSYAKEAFTQNVVKFSAMMGHLYHIFAYAPEGDDIPGATHVPLLTDAERQLMFGKDEPSRLQTWPTDMQASTFCRRAIAEIQKRIQPFDFIVCLAGHTLKPIADAFPEHIALEAGIGYEGVFAKFRAFESRPWLHHIYGREGIKVALWHDTVIPNYNDPGDFPHINKGGGKYLLYLARITKFKGVESAAKIAAACGLPLVISGQGATKFENGVLYGGDDCKVEGDFSYAGMVGHEQRAILLAGAKAVLCPTLYLEPFGSIAVEGMFSGTPCIAVDYGGFIDTVQDGVSGYRYTTLQEAVDGVKQAETLSPESVRKYAMDRYSLTAIAPKYERWFDMLNEFQKRTRYAKMARGEINAV